MLYLRSNLEIASAVLFHGISPKFSTWGENYTKKGTGVYDCDLKFYL